MEEYLEKKLRSALGCFVTGVTVVTAVGGMGNVGVTANSFSSVSLDPPLVLWSIAKNSSRHEAMISAEYYAINVLSKNQEDIALSFVKNDNPFLSLNYDQGLGNCAIIKGGIAVFECRAKELIDGGDHSIILGTVERFTEMENEPLVFYKGTFGAS